MFRTFTGGSPDRAASVPRVGVILGMLVIVAAWAVTGVSILAARQTAIDHARSESGNLAAAFASEDGRILDDTARVMNTLAAQITTASEADDLSANLHAFAREAQQAQPHAIHVSVIGSDGRLRASSLDPRVSPVDLGDREHFRVHLDGRFKGIFVSKPVMGRVSNRVTIQLTRRVDAADGTFLGVMVFGFPPAAFSSLQRFVDLGPRDVVVLTDLDSMIIARFTRDHPDGEFAVGQSVAGGARPAAFAPGAHGHYVKYGAVDGIDRILAYRRVGSYPVVVTVGLALDDVLAPVFSQTLITGGFTLVATVLLSMFGVGLTREIARRSENEILLSQERAKLIDANRRLAADNAARIEAERRLRESERRFRSYAEAASDWFWEMDADGHFTFISERFGEVAGVPVSALIGKTRAELRQEAEDDAAWRAHLDDFANRRPYRDFGYRVIRPDGAVRHIRVSGAPVFSADSEFLGYRGTGRDVTAEREAQLAEERLEQLLHESIEALGEGFALFDADERLVLCNTNYLALFKWTADVMVPGARFEDIIRIGAERRRIAERTGDAEAWIQERLDMFRNLGGRPEERLEDGRWYRRGNYRTASGGTICLRTDITAIKQAEQTLHDAIASMSEGFALFDSSEKLVLCNSRFRQIYAITDELAAPGTPIETIIRANVRRGMHPAACGQEEEWLAARLQQFRNSSGPTEQVLSDGRWLRVTDARTPSGGTISLRADITALKEAETRLLESVEALAGGFALFDADERLVLCNSRYREIYPWHRDMLVPGVTHEALLRNSIDRGFVPEAEGGVEAYVAERKARFRDPAGPFDRQMPGDRWIRFTDRRTESGDTICLRTDISDLKKIEAALRDSEATLRSILAASPDPLLVVAEDQRITLASEQAEAAFGYNQAELIGMPVLQLVPERFRVGHDGKVSGYFRDPSVRDLGSGSDLWALRSDGSEFPVEISLSPCRTADGLVTLAAIHDLTLRRNMEAALRDAQKMEALGTLAGGIAHDLNNTLVPILGLTQIVLDGMARDAAERELLDDVLASANRAKDLVAQILSFSRSEPTARHAINLRDAVADALRLVRVAISPRIDIRIDLRPAAVRILGNETQVHQVIFNLCTNAAHAIGGSGGTIDVRLEIAKIDRKAAASLSLPPRSYARLTVVDSGHGMDEETRRRIFEPFFTNKKIGEGTGLGMAIVHSVIASYEGAINIQSEVGKGTRVQIYIPLLAGDESGRSNAGVLNEQDTGALFLAGNA